MLQSKNRANLTHQKIMIVSMASAETKIGVLKAERIEDKAGKFGPDNFLILRKCPDDGYGVQIYNSDTREAFGSHYFKNFGPAWYKFKALCVDYNGREHQSVFGETRANRHEAFGLYWEYLCGDSGRKVTDFEYHYRGSYKNADQFIYNTLKPYFEASDLPSTNVELLDLDIPKIRARWFDNLVGNYTSIEVKKDYQNGFHVYLIASNPISNL